VERKGAAAQSSIAAGAGGSLSVWRSPMSIGEGIPVPGADSASRVSPPGGTGKNLSVGHSARALPPVDVCLTHAAGLGRRQTAQQRLRPGFDRSGAIERDPGLGDEQHLAHIQCLGSIRPRAPLRRRRASSCSWSRVSPGSCAAARRTVRGQ